MSFIWDNSLNQQKPQIISWLKQYCARIYGCIGDIGTGDGYYIDFLNINQLISVEPNIELRAILRQRCKQRNIDLVVCNSIDELNKSTRVAAINAIFLIHSFLYLSDTEIDQVLDIANHKCLVLITPSPENSITFDFEKEIGLSKSIYKMDKLKTIANKLQIKEIFHSSFIISNSIEKSDLAKIICNHLYFFDYNNNVLLKAEKFIDKNINDWRKPNGQIVIPQHQELHIYNLS